MPADYRVAPIFLIRLAGVPFDVLERTGTPEVAVAAREFLEREQSGGGATSASAPLDALIESAETRARQSLHDEAERILPDYLVFGSADTRHMLKGQGTALPPRNSKERGRERTLFLYLQRIAAKNETFSSFGPTTWGRSSGGENGLKIAVAPGIAERLVFFERWVAHAIADAIAEDPAVPAELRPRVTALTPFALDIIGEDVAAWPESEARQKWLQLLHELARRAGEFARNQDAGTRSGSIDAAKSLLAGLGFEKTKQRALYVATNPIAEECARDTEFVLNDSILDEVPREAARWIELWRDTYAFVAARVSRTLATILGEAGGGTPVPLPDFLRACAEARLPLQGHGLIAPAAIAFHEAKAVFAERLRPHLDKEEYELTDEDCAVLRTRFEFERFAEFTYPSADLQLAASSPEQVSRGNYRWILSELHPPVALLQHCMWWGCPDKDSLGGYLRRVGGRSFHFGFAPSDFTSHTTVRIFDALPDQVTFLAPERPVPGWNFHSPESAEVFATGDGDVRVRHGETGEDFGSFARAWLIPLGFHPFQFSVAPHTPRLRCGSIIVQRRTWTIAAAELALGSRFATRDLVLGAERLRAARRLPRHIYIRPTEQALRRAGAEGRDKDTKPVFIDLENIIALEILQRWLAKAGEIEATEMLPAPGEMLWQEQDGRRSFELRTLIIPRG